MKEVALTREVENSKLKGWIWEKYKDGSGGLIDNNGNTFLIYDLVTQEYKIAKWEFFSTYPLRMDNEEFFKFAENLAIKKMNEKKTDTVDFNFELYTDAQLIEEIKRRGYTVLC